MIDLLRTDLKRALKDKLIIVLLIIAGAFALMTPLLYKAIFFFMELDNEIMPELEMLGIGVYAKSMFFSSFSLGNNFGLILPVFVAIILCKDFGHGTIRNKIICGKPRISIYFSTLITCIILIFAFILAHAILTLLVSLVLFKYQATAFTIKDFWYLLASVGLKLFGYLVVCAILTFFVVFMKNAGLSVVMYFVVMFLMTIVGGIMQTTLMFTDPATTGYKVMEFFTIANVYTSPMVGSGTSYELKEVLYYLLPNLAIIAIFVGLGLIIFKKKDLK